MSFVFGVTEGRAETKRSGKRTPTASSFGSWFRGTKEVGYCGRVYFTFVFPNERRLAGWGFSPGGRMDPTKDDDDDDEEANFLAVTVSLKRKLA